MQLLLLWVKDETSKHLNMSKWQEIELKGGKGGLQICEERKKQP